MKKYKERILDKIHREFIKSNNPKTISEIVSFLEKESLKKESREREKFYGNDEYLIGNETKKELEEIAEQNLNRLQLRGFIKKINLLNGSSIYEKTEEGVKPYKA